MVNPVIIDQGLKGTYQVAILLAKIQFLTRVHEIWTPDLFVLSSLRRLTGMCGS